jgi:hypothetical protein
LLRKAFLLCLLAAPAFPQSASVTLTWVAPTTYTDGTPLGTQALSYNVYEYVAAQWTKIGTSATLTYTAAALTAGAIYNFRVTAVAAGIESVASNQVSVTAKAQATPPKTPNPPASLTAK